MKPKEIIIFALGAAVGAGAMWLGLKKHYEAITQEEINSVKETYMRLRKDIEQETEQLSKADTKTEMLNIIQTHYGNTANEHTDYSSNYSKADAGNDASGPYVISPREFGNRQGYDITELTYYDQDRVLVDGFGEIVDDPENMVGNGFEEHFGEYEEDSVFIRNDRLECDFEILRDLGSYDETR